MAANRLRLSSYHNSTKHTVFIHLLLHSFIPCNQIKDSLVENSRISACKSCLCQKFRLIIMAPRSK